MKDPWPLEYPTARRNRNCRCCNGRLVKEHRAAPTPTDPHYKVAVCPTCDLTPAPTLGPWPQKRPPTDPG